MLFLMLSFLISPVAGTEGGIGERSGRRVPPGCGAPRAGTERTRVERWKPASARWGRAPPGLREGGGSVSGPQLGGLVSRAIAIRPDNW